jgi:hypothetical protein
MWYKLAQKYAQNKNWQDLTLDQIDTTAQGSCMISIQILANQLMSQNRNFTVHEGYVTFPDNSIKFQHTWLEENGIINDPTVNQFNTKTKYLDKIQYIKGKKFNPQQYVAHCGKYPLPESEFYIKKQASKNQGALPQRL